MTQIAQGLFIAGFSWLDPNDEDCFKKDRTTYVVALYPPTREQKEVILGNANAKLLSHPIEDTEKADWKGAWENTALQNFLKSFRDEELKAEEQKKPILLIACEMGIRRSAFIACCFLVTYHRDNFEPHEAMRLVDKKRRSRIDNQQIVQFYDANLHVLEELGGPGYKFQDDLLRQVGTRKCRTPFKEINVTENAQD